MLTDPRSIEPRKPLIVYAPIRELHDVYMGALKKLMPGRRFGSGTDERLLDDNELIITEFPPPPGCTGQWIEIEAFFGPQTKPHKTPRKPPAVHTDGLPLEPWIPMTDPVDKKVVGKTMEELFEFIAATARLGQAVSRCFIQGVDAEEPTTGKSNRDSLSEEIADVEANLRLMKERFALDTEAIEVRASMKWSRQRVWHKMPAEALSGKPVSYVAQDEPDNYPSVVTPIRPLRAEPIPEGLIFDWGRQGDPSRRDTLTVPMMLRTLSDAEVYEIAEHKNTYFTSLNGWTWNVRELKIALIKHGMMPERYKPD